MTEGNGTVPEVEPPDDEAVAGAAGPGELHGSDDIRTALIAGETFAVKPVQYQVVGNRAIFEGDIVLGTVEEVERRTALLQEQFAVELRGVGTDTAPGDQVDPDVGPPVERAAVITGSNRRWPGGIVPWETQAGTPADVAQTVRDAIAVWEANTRLAFPAHRAGDAQWVVFRSVAADGCNSPVGRQDVTIFQPAGQEIHLETGGCVSGQAIHETGHAVGLWHEQSRQDRDSFITINWNNIQSGKSSQFNQHISDGDDVGPYDFDSVMHYGATAFGILDAGGNPTTTIVPKTPLPAGVFLGQRNHLSTGDRGAVAWMYGSVYPHAQNSWSGRFRGHPESDLLYYSPAKRRWYITAGTSTWTFRDIGSTAGFGDLADGRPFWTGDFTGSGRTEVLFYSPGDDNWWLGQLVVEDAACPNLRLQAAQLGQQISDLQSSKGGLDPRNAADRAEIREINKQIGAVGVQLTGVRADLAARRCGPTDPADASREMLTWSLVGNTVGFGHGIHDGRPFWTGDFTGNGSADVLFYYPGDDNWWLGSITNGQLVWTLVGNTVGFGHGINDGRPFWTGDFTGNGSADVLFYYPGDDNWWLGSITNGQLVWTLVGNTVGFGHGINDGRPFWTGDFTGDGKADILFYYPGDDNWWMGSLGDVAGENAECAQLRSRVATSRRDIAALQAAKDGLDPRNAADRAEIRQINQQITALNQQITAANTKMASLSCPLTPNPGGIQLVWSLVGNTRGFGHGINDGRPFWTADFTGERATDILFHFHGDLNWWRGSIAGGSLTWTLVTNW